MRRSRISLLFYFISNFSLFDLILKQSAVKTNLVRGDIKLLRPLLIVRGDEVGVRSCRLDVILCEYCVCFSGRTARPRECEPVATDDDEDDVGGGGDGGNVTFGSASSVFFDVELFL